MLIAPDKFKGTMTAKQAAAAMRRGLQRVWPRAEVTVLALADGGEGFTECLVDARQGRLHAMSAVDALGRALVAHWGEIDSHTGVLEISAASGLNALPPGDRNPLLTSTLGTGIVLREMLSRGMRDIYLGLGGSATNDAGLGIATALGFRFLDSNRRAVTPNGGALRAIAQIEPPQSLPAMKLVIATDVDNPLYGPQGAAYQFAGQKGADEAMIRRLDEGLQRFAAVVAEHIGRDLAALAGAGAAGGVGFGMMALLNAERRSGFDVLRAQLQLDSLIAAHDLVLTGEGCFDATSFAGKTPFRVAQLARAGLKPVWGVFGRCEEARVADHFDRHVTIGGIAETLHENLERLANAAERLASAQPQ